MPGYLLAQHVPAKGSMKPVRVVNFSELASREAAANQQPSQLKRKVIERMPVPQSLPVKEGVPVIKDKYGKMTTTSLAPPESSLAPESSIEANLPAPAYSFPALGDNGTIIPPDTHGASGPNHLMVTLNSQVRIQTRTGATISTVSLDNFFGQDAFDPKVCYDPYGNRWIFVACANARSANSSVMVAVSRSSDPTAGWSIYTIDVDATNKDWFDYPSVGFNKDWIVIQGNMFAIGGGFKSSRIYALTKSEFYAGGFATWRFWTRTGIGGTQSPALTYNTTLNTMYLLQNWNGNSSGNGFLRLYTITGSVGSEVFTEGPFISTPNPWSEGGVGGPQLGDSRRIDNGDSRMMNVVYRNGALWCVQTVFLPAGAPTRSSVQWWQLTTAGAILQRGRIDDAGGTFFHAYPSIAVNSTNDALIGYSRFSANQFASANYSFRFGSDAVNTVQPSHTFKSGEASYFKDFGTGRNRWGDYSATTVDPVNDQDFWTIQEYAESPSSLWGTWWAKVSKVAQPIVNSFAPASGAPGVGVFIQGGNFINVSAVYFNGVAASQFYVAGPGLLYATVPSGATTGQIRVETQGGTATSGTAFTVAAIASTWLNKTGLTNARSQHGAVATNGKIYVFGGWNSSGLLSSLEIYNPATNSWSAGASMPVATRGLSFALGSNGLIYAISGFTSNAITQAFSYNPATNSWATLASIPGGVWEGAAAATANGKVFVFGGEPVNTASSSNTTRIYDIATNTWSSGAVMPVAVKQHSAVTGNDGKIYILGGRSNSGAPVNNVQVYDPVANTWALGAGMIIPKTQFGAVKAADGRIYVVGGKAQNTNNTGPFFHSVEIYNPATNTWAVGPVLPIQVGELEAVNLGGNLYALGGSDGVFRNYNFQLNLAPAIASFAPTKGPAGIGVLIKGSNLGIVSTVKFNGVAATQIYKASSTLLYVTVPAGATTGKIEVIGNSASVFSASDFTVSGITSSWVSKAGIVNARVQHGTVATAGKIYVFGGRNPSTVFNSLEIYNPATNTWSVGAPMPVATRGMSVALGSNGAIYAISGVTNTPVSNVYKYTPSTNTWVAVAPIPQKVFEAAAAATPNGKIYVFGGEPSTAGGTSTNATRIYNIATNSWSTGASMPVAVQQHSAVLGSDGKIYIIGGRTLSAGPPVGLVQIYNPATNTWSAGASMLIPKVQFGCVKASNGLIYVIGGKAAEPNFIGPFFHTVEVYNPVTNSWSNGPVLPIQVAQQTAALVNDNIYAITGADGLVRNYNFQLVLPPVAPTNLVATATSSSSINLKWKDNSLNETGFQIERGTASAGPFTPIASVGANVSSFNNTGLTPNKTYYYRVRATNSNGNSPYSNVASATTPGTVEPAITAVEGKEVNGEKLTRLITQPNPVRTIAKISFTVAEDQPVQLGVFDLNGNLLQQLYRDHAKAGRLYQFDWSVGTKPAGVYFSRLITPKGVYVEKLIVQPR